MHDFITKTLDAKHNKSQGCYQWLWSGIPSFSGSLIASKKWAKKETHSYWQWCFQLNRNASYLSHFVLWQQKKAVWSISRYVHHAAHAIHCGSFIEKQLQILWTGRITEWRKQSYHVRDRLRYCTAGSPIVNTSKFFFWLIMQCNQAARKWRNAWSQPLVSWSTNESWFFCKRKFQVPVQYNESAKKSCYLKFTQRRVSTLV